MSTPTTSSSSDGEYCVICQAIMNYQQVANDIQVQRQSNYSFIEHLKYSNPNPLSYVTLTCSHTFHRECLIKWIHYNNTQCPLCRQPIELDELQQLTWKIQNIAVRTKCSPESLRLGLKPEGWYNVQIQINPPNNEKLKVVKYVFHPAFSLNKLVLAKPPYDLVMKLVSNSVDIVVEAETQTGRKFTFLHQLSKEMCVRVYYYDIYNGSDTLREIDPLQHFKDQLETYKRDRNYYDIEMPAPARFQGNQDREKNIFAKLLDFFQT